MEEYTDINSQYPDTSQLTPRLGLSEYELKPLGASHDLML